MVSATRYRRGAVRSCDRTLYSYALPPRLGAHVRCRACAHAKPSLQDAADYVCGGWIISRVIGHMECVPRLQNAGLVELDNPWPAVHGWDCVCRTRHRNLSLIHIS